MGEEWGWISSVEVGKRFIPQIKNKGMSYNPNIHRFWGIMGDTYYNPWKLKYSPRELEQKWCLMKKIAAKLKLGTIVK